MADNSCGKKSTECPHCSSASQKKALCICSCKTKLSPMSVVEMSQTSSTGSSEFIVSPEKKKEKGASKDVASGKDSVIIKDSTSQHKLVSHSLIPSLHSSLSMGSCQLIHCLLYY